MPPRKDKLSADISDIVESASNSVTAAPSETVKAAKPETVVSDKRPNVKRHHVSLYISPRVDRAVKQIALDTGRRPHEVYLNAIRRELKDHGQDFDALMRDDGSSV